MLPKKVVNGLFLIELEHQYVPVSLHHPRYRVLQSAMVSMRKQAELSQVQLAERLELGQSFVSKVERGEAYIELTLFIDWCQACGVQPGAVLNALPTLQSERIAPLRAPAKSETS
jgi:transcriptional regulator with XRE-family HTH domain